MQQQGWNQMSTSGVSYLGNPMLQCSQSRKAVAHSSMVTAEDTCSAGTVTTLRVPTQEPVEVRNSTPHSWGPSPKAIYKA